MQERGLTGHTGDFREWPKHTQRARMRESGHFSFTREVMLHHIEQGDAARFLELILTNSRSHQFKLKTITEQEIGFDRLSSAAFQSIGSEPIPWYVSYRVRIGIK